MGTETSAHTQTSPPVIICNVKLNNPLMGTEAYRLQPLCTHERYRQVKLNNPLMGTETYRQL